ncbi:hypothetical protein [Kutzneria sp. NPDC052558]|uniref:hypothetical protein n=1 Tax=Kutzneria sp. NPDC052558 TaxID=3364121 RepID=UPI0037C5B17F
MTFARRFAGLVGAAVAATFAIPMATAAPASALTNIEDVHSVEARCHASIYKLCLYYNRGRTTAWWGAVVDVDDLAGYTFFPNTGAGSGSPVKNNAAAASCDMTASSICYVFYNRNQSGPTDWLHGGWSGKLVETYNEDASIHLSQGA